MGSTPSDIMILGLAPYKKSCGKSEKRRSSRFKDESAGKLMDSVMRKTISRKIDDAYITNLVKCPLLKGQKKPNRAQIASCRGYFDKELKLVKPKLIITLGREVGKDLIPGFKSVMYGRGKPMKMLEGTIILPTYHPLYALRHKHEAEMIEDLYEYVNASS